MQSKAATVEEYLAELTPDRRAAIEAVRKVVRSNIDKDIREGIQNGMICYFVPHEVFPNGYHCNPSQPVPFAALASQKNHMSLYLMFAYTDGEEERLLREGFARAGKKIDMGKSCLRFRKVEDLELDVIGSTFKRVPARKFIDTYVANVGEGAWKSRTKARP